MDVDFRDLELLEALGDGATMTAAAQRLFVTQPALSQRLAQLEQRLGTALFERSPRGMRPTAAGRRLLTAARSALAELRSAARDIERERDGGRRSLRVSSQCSTNYRWLAPLAQRHRERHPDVDLRLVTCPGDEPIPALRANDVDVAVVTKTGKQAPGVELTPLFADELVAVVGARHPWAGRSVVDAQAIAEATFVLYEVYDQARPEPLPLPLPTGVRPARVTTAPMVTQLLVDLVASDGGVTVLPRWVAEDYVAAGDVAIVRMTEQPPIASWFVATRQAERDDVVLAFARELGQRAKEVFDAARRR